MGLDVRLLGRVEVHRDGSRVELRGEQLRTLVAYLALTPGVSRSVDGIVDALWPDGGGGPPANPRETVHTYVARIRKALGADSVASRDGGYALEVAPRFVDAGRFEALVRAAGDRGCPLRKKVELLDDALGLWRGAALAGLEDRDWARPDALRWEEQRASAEDDRAEALLDLGEAGAAVPLLSAAALARPLRERTHALLMQALFACERQAEALRVYQRYRGRLGDELGLDPGERIATLERSIAAGHRPPAGTGRGASGDASGWADDADERPHGTVTLLFTSLEDSTRQWQAHPASMARAVARHDDIVRKAVASAGGYVFGSGGDGFCVAFASVRSGVRAAVDAQRALLAEPWPDDLVIRSRMGLHTGETDERNGGYFGTAVHRAALLMAAAHGGQVVCSAAVQQVLLGGNPLDDVMLADLGSVRLRGIAGWERVFAVLAPGLPDRFEPLAAERGSAAALPLLAERLLGRDRDIERVAELVGEHSLVTLTGPGGVGKTSLALAVAQQERGRARDGCWWVELAPLGAGDDVAPVVAGALGVRSRFGATALDALVTALADQELLLVLDNCEHLLAPTAGVVGTLVRRCPGVRILATSRHRLAVPGEREVAVRPLDVESDAVALLAERIGRPELLVDPGRRHELVAIATALDGLPLALELAAARCRTMALPDVAARLRDRFRLLDRGSDTAPRSTLRGTVQWSYDLLDPAARAAYQRLGVFAGSFPLDAAEAVVGGDPFAVDDALGSLVDESLVEFDGTRYRMLETTRSYAREQLAASCEEESVLAAHEQWVVDLVRAAHEGLRGPDEPAWVERLDLSWADVRAVLLRSLERDDLTVAVELVVHLAFEAFWRRPEAFGWARRTAEQLGDRPHPDRHDLLGAAGIAAWASGDPVQALALGREALAIEPDPAHSFDLLAWLAAGPHGSGWCGELEDAITLAERALQAVQDDVPARAFWSATLQILRVLAARGGDDPALPAAAIADADATGNPTLRSYARFACATGLASPQDGTLALPHLEVALDLARSVRNTWLLDEIAGALGTIGPAEEASARLGPALELTAQRLRLGYVMHAWSGLATVAIVLLQLGRVEDAFVAVAAARGSPAGPAFERVTWQPLRAFMCAYLEADRVDELERRAASMDLPALLELARSG